MTRIQPPTPSKIVFTEDGALFPDAPPEKKVPMSAQKARRSTACLARLCTPPSAPSSARLPNPPPATATTIPSASPPSAPPIPASRPCAFTLSAALTLFSLSPPLPLPQRRELSGNATNIFSGEEQEHPALDDPASSPDAASPAMARRPPRTAFPPRALHPRTLSPPAAPASRLLTFSHAPALPCPVRSCPPPGPRGQEARGVHAPPGAPHRPPPARAQPGGLPPGPRGAPHGTSHRAPSAAPPCATARSAQPATRVCVCVCVRGFTAGITPACRV